METPSLPARMEYRIKGIKNIIKQTLSLCFKLIPNISVSTTLTESTVENRSTSRVR